MEKETIYRIIILVLLIVSLFQFLTITIERNLIRDIEPAVKACKTEKDIWKAKYDSLMNDYEVLQNE